MKGTKSTRQKDRVANVIIKNNSLMLKAVNEFLDLDTLIRGHLKRREICRATAEGAMQWFKTLEQLRINEAMLKETMRELSGKL